MLPKFLIVGAEKAGTTALSFMLADHPDDTSFESALKHRATATQSW